MSIFGTRYNEDEKYLLKVHTELFSSQMGLDEKQAKQIAKALLDDCIKKSKEAGFYDLPMNFGDIVVGLDNLNNSKHSGFLDFMKESLSYIKSEGVTDDDIRWWWNMSEVERIMAREIDAISRRETFMHFLEEGLDPPDAALKMKNMFPTYGDDPDGDPQLKGEHRPLPYELKKRVGEWIIKKMKADPTGQDFKKKCEEAGSENAFIRQEIRKGNL